MPMRATLLHYSQGARFELVGESTDDRTSYYSTERAEAGRKFQTDEVMVELIEHLDDEGFAEYGQEGRAPSSGGTLILLSLETEVDGTTRCWMLGKDAQVDEARAFKLCMKDFLDLYNVSQAFQIIENPEGRDVFRDRRQPSPRR